MATSNEIQQSYIKAAETIKNAILSAQYEAARGVNNIQLMLYYSVGRFISHYSRKAQWGTAAIATISHLLTHDMPGLRGFSEANIKKMRTFYEEWRELDAQTPEAKSLIQTSDLPEINSLIQVVCGVYDRTMTNRWESQPIKLQPTCRNVCARLYPTKRNC